MVSNSSCVLPTVRAGACLPTLPLQPCVKKFPYSPTPVLSRAGGNSSAFRTRFTKSVRPELKKACNIVAMASSEGENEPAQRALDAFKNIQESWEKVDDKLAIGGLGFAALLVLWASTGLIGAIDKLPIIPDFFEFVGILFTGWFVYRFLLFKPDREELLKKVDDAKSKITGQ
eukprot:TRINITY_DN15413_c0_g1_i1.p1 TRINITY_DN15413_c0_g1~~TRINITY_DN15413_c0_g1_i1.p1  ORF type:complete len:173 (-),score=26.86 TRINITY_DN15413_c0_g1_i1:454-972(-)